jgi:hypothetical protein
VSIKQEKFEHESFLPTRIKGSHAQSISIAGRANPPTTKASNTHAFLPTLQVSQYQLQ